ncbi:MAG: histidine triad nucleotide-binding protein [Deltaproteobacteria bacterium]|nr:histidine triad nucleotide-binding protein [Deltaproteobacteria bacterium]
MAEDCIFCKIVNGDIPSRKVYEDDKVLAFDDINPMAPVHVIIIPKQHIPTLLDIDPDHADIMGDILSAVREVSAIKGIDQKGFRTVINCNEEGGQVIFHLHMHLLGGTRLRDDLG